MIRKTHECVGCPPEIGCNKSICRYWNSCELVCDQCGATDVDRLYWAYGLQMCADCVLSSFDVVELEDAEDDIP